MPITLTIRLPKVMTCQFSRIVILVVLLVMTSGCVLPGRDPAGLPKRYRVSSDQLQIRSDLKVTKDHSLFNELESIRAELTELLELPKANRPVVVHLFKDEDRYSAYMNKHHPNLPPRRAFFIGTPTQLAVFAHWGPSMTEDLRHEYTHGVLHASLNTVPLWLDEGIAEYFEIETRNAQRRHPDHTSKLAIAVSNGWRPDLYRLEKIETVEEMQREDYQEAWAWVHYLLNDCPDGRAMLVDYCESLRYSQKPPRFAERVYEHVPAPDVRLATYVTSTLAEQGPAWALGQKEE